MTTCEPAGRSHLRWLVGLVVIAASACGSSGPSSAIGSQPAVRSGGAPTATGLPAGSTAGPTPESAAGVAALRQDDCTAPGLTGTQLNMDPSFTNDTPFSMVIADPWVQSSDMGRQGVLWKAGDNADGQGTSMAVRQIGVAPDAASAANEAAQALGVAVMTCQVGGDTAYLVASRSAQGTTEYEIDLMHGGVHPITVHIRSSGQVPDSVWVPQVKLMLGSWTWG